MEFLNATSSYVPGLLYVEHGNQYEYTTSIRNFLNPELPIDYPGTGKQIELEPRLREILSEGDAHASLSC